MDWVEGVPLYEWAARLNPSSREVLRVLAQAARALEATHAAGAVHRDVKGANILVSPTGDRAFLTDYGAGNYSGAEPLTKDGLPPGTDNYRSPEAWDFELHRPRNAPSAYKAQPADDVFALGVSAYRCVTGTYLPAFEVREEETGPGSLVWTAPPAPRELNPRVTPELSALILRMLSERPEERPTPGELAEALKQAASRPAPGVDQCLFDTPSRAPARTVWTLARTRVPAWLAACALLVGALSAVAIGSALRTERNTAASNVPVGVGDTSLTAPETPLEESSGPKSIKDSKLPKPVKGQRRAPHCQPPTEVTINGGCWLELPALKPPCGDLGYEWQGRCYAPNYPLPRDREPTSGPGQ